MLESMPLKLSFLLPCLFNLVSELFSSREICGEQAVFCSYHSSYLGFRDPCKAIIAFELARHWCSCRFWTNNLNSSLLNAIVLLDSCFGCVKAPYCAVTTFPQGASSDSIVLLGICMYVTDNRKVGDKSTRRLLNSSENLSVF
jgi:hypothetical protein